ncbi:MAG: hypothetical protein EP334_10170 [Gammaproteobacteria bacterium]|nr:MAG: hypothetical protein EP334_10170 [Gammaproteobacteria bacterium]
MSAELYTFTPPGPGSGGRRNTLNEAEHAALESLVHDGYLLAYVMYVSGFRRRMDYLTRTVGSTEHSRVSLDFFQAMLERHTKRGSHWGFLRPTQDEVRGEISALEKVGLIRRLPKDRRTDPLLFHLPLADAGQLRPQEEPQRNPKEEPQRKSQQSRGFQADEPQRPKADEPHMTGIYIQQQHIDVILQAYHERLPNCPKVHIVSQDLELAMAAIWNKDSRHHDPRFWDWYFGEMCAKSNFLMGREYNQRRGKFKANLLGLLQEKTFTKIMNGEYT